MLLPAVKILAIIGGCVLHFLCLSW